MEAIFGNFRHEKKVILICRYIYRHTGPPAYIVARLLTIVYSMLLQNSPLPVSHDLTAGQGTMLLQHRVHVVQCSISAHGGIPTTVHGSGQQLSPWSRHLNCIRTGMGRGCPLRSGTAATWPAGTSNPLVAARSQGGAATPATGRSATHQPMLPPSYCS